ncbi:hypothetical protein ND00_32280 [Clostridium sp. L74]|nr:hypothetical protein ND00_32280 [Clostridium sp. L74]
MIEIIFYSTLYSICHMILLNLQYYKIINFNKILMGDI